jgi:hypothetical protein
MFAALSGGLSVRNTTGFPVLVVLSQVCRLLLVVAGCARASANTTSSVPARPQLTPLHWARIEPGQTHTFSVGRVWFTVSACPYDESRVPTQTGVAARIAGLAVSAVLPTSLLVFAGAAVLSGVTSVKGCKRDGVYADGKTLVLCGMADASAGVYLMQWGVRGPRRQRDGAGGSRRSPSSIRSPSLLLPPPLRRTSTAGRRSQSRRRCRRSRPSSELIWCSGH